MLTDRYAYSPIIRRKPFRWPNGARIALMVAPNIECFNIDKVIPGAPSSYLPDVTGYALRDYGARIGVFRLMEVLDKHGIRATVLDGADVGESAFIGAGALVVPRTVVPARTLWLGAPAKLARPLTDEEVEDLKHFHRNYLVYKREAVEAGEAWAGR